MRSGALSLEMVTLSWEGVPPKAWRCKDVNGRLPLHTLVGNDVLTAEMVSLIWGRAPPDMWQVADAKDGRTPLHWLMGNKSLMAEAGIVEPTSSRACTML